MDYLHKWYRAILQNPPPNSPSPSTSVSNPSNSLNHSTPAPLSHPNTVGQVIVLDGDSQRNDLGQRNEDQGIAVFQTHLNHIQVSGSAGNVGGSRPDSTVSTSTQPVHLSTENAAAIKLLLTNPETAAFLNRDMLAQFDFQPIIPPPGVPSCGNDKVVHATQTRTQSEVLGPYMQPPPTNTTIRLELDSPSQDHHRERGQNSRSRNDPGSLSFNLTTSEHPAITQTIAIGEELSRTEHQDHVDVTMSGTAQSEQEGPFIRDSQLLSGLANLDAPVDGFPLIESQYHATQASDPAGESEDIDFEIDAQIQQELGQSFMDIDKAGSDGSTDHAPEGHLDEHLDPASSGVTGFGDAMDVVQESEDSNLAIIATEDAEGAQVVMDVVQESEDSNRAIIATEDAEGAQVVMDVVQESEDSNRAIIATEDAEGAQVVMDVVQESEDSNRAIIATEDAEGARVVMDVVQESEDSNRAIIATEDAEGAQVVMDVVQETEDSNRAIIATEDAEGARVVGDNAKHSVLPSSHTNNVPQGSAPGTMSDMGNGLSDEEYEFPVRNGVVQDGIPLKRMTERPSLFVRSAELLEEAEEKLPDTGGPDAKTKADLNEKNQRLFANNQKRFVRTMEDIIDATALDHRPDEPAIDLPTHRDPYTYEEDPDGNYEHVDGRYVCVDDKERPGWTKDVEVDQYGERWSRSKEAEEGMFFYKKIKDEEPSLADGEHKNVRKIAPTHIS